MPSGFENDQDPRSRLVREKYFCVRPRPMERWLWSKRVPASAERVFWLHWQEGMQRGDWCSEVPLSRVARECQLDVSTVTRAYQILTRLGCLRRTDQGRDPANPFQQATALTEIRIPRELLMELHGHPNRRATSGLQERGSAQPRQGAEEGSPVGHHQEAAQERQQSSAEAAGAAVVDGFVGEGSCLPHAMQGAPATEPASITTAEHAPTDPFSGLSGRERVRAISKVIDTLSPSERHAYQEALRMHQPNMAFDADTRISESDRMTLRQILASMCRSTLHDQDSSPSPSIRSSCARAQRNRRLTPFELGRLSRDLQSASSTAAAPELMRQVVWSIESGALKRFDPRHALHIALKKIREGKWTRPHRMPPNWSRALSNAPAPEACGHA